jgi:glycerol-3-phosphate dehydrogenase (NAD(P)+)
MIISILGGGSWGTALAVHLAKKNHQVKIWEFFEAQAKEMQEKRVCKLLPEVKLTKNISVSSDLSQTLEDSELVLVVVPSDKVEATIENAAPDLKKQPIIICSKGFANDLRLLSEVVKNKVEGKVYCLSGPTHAEEVCKGMFSGIVLAGEKGKEELKKEIENENLKVELSEDIVGVQIAAALKNPIAIFVGILEGMGMGDNARALVMTKGLEEIKQIGLKWGAKEETFCGLAGKGKKLAEITEKMDMVVEGVTTLKFLMKLKAKFKLELPLMTGLHQILFDQKDPKEILINL